MTKFSLLLLAAALAAPGAANAQPFDLPEGVGVEEQATPQQEAANQRASELGLQIYLHDQAAWHGTDWVRARLDFADHPEIKGYVTEELASGNIGLVYYAEFDGALYEFARLEMAGGKVISGEIMQTPQDHPLSRDLQRQVGARQAALEQGAKEQLQLCTSGAVNTVILPPSETGEIPVYLLSAPVEPGRFPLGGHYLFNVDAGGKVVSGRAFMHSCTDVPVINRHVINGPENYTTAHLLDDHPNEILHYVARNMNLPLVIGTGNVLWTLDYRDSAGGDQDEAGGGE
ncbi:hypothetical protein GRI43_01100 [Altererythrobacter luteolus]|uniref:Uncharacterized protein n=1 Tax=Pontixanthobacter luteolus TaxID=295089 RepID=A0A6I4UVT5_9SPHN|nr:hypothetical protein [Pontixanthobacter luteolus]MXP45989.1 hypothetical protein [Pontixanthobacter luteolus]